MLINHNKGFTLIELLVVVLIIAILAAVATQHYNKAVERSRIAEVVGLLQNIAHAQQRRFMNVNSFSENFRSLDVTPRASDGADYYTHGESLTGTSNNGFKITLSGKDFTDGKVTATRYASSGTLQFSYQLERYYVNHATACRSTPGASDFSAKNGASVCADYCGIDWLEVGRYCCADQTTPAGGTENPEGGCKAPSAAEQAH